MSKSISFIVLLLSTTFILNAQSFWSDIDESSIQLRSDQDRKIIPSDYHTLSLRLDGLKSYLAKAPEENLMSNKTSTVEVEMPMPDGAFVIYKIYKSSAMMSEISKRYPSIQTFIGHGEDGSNMIFDITYSGFHGSIWSSEGIIYIDPYATDDLNNYIVYHTKNHIDHEAINTTCGMTAEDFIDDGHDNTAHTSSLRTENIPLRTYRLAIASTGEHSIRFTSLEDVLANMNTAVNRLNLIFMNELSIKVELIDNNDQIIFMDPDTDPYPNASLGSSCLQLNTGILNQKIGNHAYDLGHVFTKRCTDVGGVAYLGSVCNTNKGGGVTCITSANDISFTMVRITAHEMGHQFGASHTFNNCSGNESYGTAYEPGGGSTIMSYGGLCGNNSYVSTNDDYYHNASLEQMFQETRNSSSVCGTTMDIGNHAPVAIHDYEDGFFIPISTPFELTGDGTDEDGDELTFHWEQMDKIGYSVPLGQPEGTSPLFRSYPPTTEKTRYCPKVENVRYNVVDPTEVMASYEREMSFRLVVRDNHPGGGLVDWKDVEFATTDEAGPFLVTYPNVSNLDFMVGSTLDVQWDVAGTDGGLVNSPFVDISLSLDDGKTFPYTVAINVANDGSHPIVLPNYPSFQCRVKVKSSNNIFYDIGDRSFAIIEPETGFFFEPNDRFVNLCLPATKSIDLASVGFGGYNESITYDIPATLPAGIIPSFENNGAEPGNVTTLNFDMNESIYNGVLEIPIRGITADDTLEQLVVMELKSNNFSEFELSFPENNKSGADRLLTFEWENIVDADTYTIEIATNPAFGDTKIFTTTGITEGSYLYNQLLELNSVYYWRVTAHNRCMDVVSETFVLATKSRSCSTYTATNLPKAISASGTQTIEALFDIGSNSNVVDVNVKNINLFHDYVGNLSGTMVSPSGTEVRLWYKKCGNLGSINCGFDDEISNNLTCPMVGKVFHPDSSLSAFNGEPVDGQWKFSLRDHNPGDGGQFNSLEVEICVDKALNSPYLFLYNPLGVKPENENIVTNSFLHVKDDDTNSESLKFTITSLPRFGLLRYNEVPMILGQQFTQSDINNNRISYKHTGGSEAVDTFYYNVIDDAGGWLPTSMFEINIGEQYPDAVNDLTIDELYDIFPNPTSEQLTLRKLVNDNTAYDVFIYDINGKIIISELGLKNSLISFEMHNYSAGIYVLTIVEGNKLFQKKISIVK